MHTSTKCLSYCIINLKEKLHFQLTQINVKIIPHNIQTPENAVVNVCPKLNQNSMKDKHDRNDKKKQQQIFTPGGLGIQVSLKQKFELHNTIIRFPI